MTDSVSTPAEFGVIDRAKRLLAVSSFAPAGVAMVAFIGLALTDNDGGSDLVSTLPALGSTTLLAGADVWIWRRIRNDTHHWRGGVSLIGAFGAFSFATMAVGSGIGEQWGIGDTPRTVAYAVIALALGLIGWLPASKAAKLVTGNLSAEVVRSSLKFRFPARGTVDFDHLTVTADSVEFAVRLRSPSAYDLVVPLRDIDFVRVHTVTEDQEYPPPPGGRLTPMRVKAGEVVVFGWPDGELVFGTKDATMVQRLVSARVAVARERAASK